MIIWLHATPWHNIIMKSVFLKKVLKSLKNDFFWKNHKLKNI
jgi:hypothetical protein